MLVDVTSMIASVGSSTFGSGTVSTRTSRLPCQVTAFIAKPFARLAKQTHQLATAQLRTNTHAPAAETGRRVRVPRLCKRRPPVASCQDAREGVFVASCERARLASW